MLLKAIDNYKAGSFV